jgi:hypothetical protein
MNLLQLLLADERLSPVNEVFSLKPISTDFRGANIGIDGSALFGLPGIPCWIDLTTIPKDGKDYGKKENPECPPHRSTHSSTPTLTPIGSWEPPWL